MAARLPQARMYAWLPSWHLRDLEAGKGYSDTAMDRLGEERSRLNESAGSYASNMKKRCASLRTAHFGPFP